MTQQTRYKKQQKDLSVQFEYGQTPPQEPEAEKIVLGSLCVFKTMPEVSMIVRPDDFYSLPHRTIFQAALNVYNAGQDVDIITITQELRKTKELEVIGGITYLSDILSETPYVDVLHQAKLIYEASVRRNMIRNGHQLVQKAYDIGTNFRELSEFSDTVFENNTEAKGIRKTLTMRDHLTKTIKSHQKALNNNGIVGVRPGIGELAKSISYAEGELIIVGGRPSMGKTAEMVNDALGLVYQQVPVPTLVFELEMTTEAFLNRGLACLTGIPLEAIRTGMYQYKDHEVKAIEQRINELADLPLYLEDEPLLTVYEVISRTRRYVKKFGVRVVFIDYLQLIELETGINKADALGQVTRQLKIAAKKLGITIIAYSQLSRESDRRQGNHKPVLADLRDSGSIEQDADIVIFLYRPEYYGIKFDDQGKPTHNLLELIIAKHREGKLSVVKTEFRGEYCSIGEFEPTLF